MGNGASIQLSPGVVSESWTPCLVIESRASYRSSTIFVDPQLPAAAEPSTKMEPREKRSVIVGRQLLTNPFKGIRIALNPEQPYYKRVYKNVVPTCCDFIVKAEANYRRILIGFSFGQIQLSDGGLKGVKGGSPSRLFNEDRSVDKTAVTCVKWIPDQPQSFLVSYASGYMYMYKEELECPQGTTEYKLLKKGNGYSVHTCNTKSSCNPVFRWQIGTGSLNQFAFSGSDAKMLATVSEDGYLRIFDYHKMELLCFMKSYFAGLSTVAWSPDAKIIATGGQDDLLTIFHVSERRVVLRGKGHKSWIAQVEFDEYECDVEGDCDSKSLRNKSGERDNESVASMIAMKSESGSRPESFVSGNSIASLETDGGTEHYLRYRVGTFGQDKQICMWDVTEDTLKPQIVKRPRNRLIGISPPAVDTHAPCFPQESENSALLATAVKPQKSSFFNRVLSFGRPGGRSSVRGPHTASSVTNDESNGLGSPICPRMEDVLIIELTVCKQIRQEKVISLEFRPTSIVTMGQDSYVCEWVRPKERYGKNVSFSVAHPHVLEEKNLMIDTGTKSQRADEDAPKDSSVYDGKSHAQAADDE